MEIRRKHAVLIPALAALVAVIPLAFAVAPRALADDAAAPASSPTPTATASIVKVERWKAPRKKVVHRKFRPWAHPTPAQVREIIRNEARRWGVSAASLSRRVNCESRYRWSATNGQYAGVLQFSASTFYRGMSTIRSHKLKIVRTTTRRVHDARITHYSDGRKVTRRTTPRRQHVIRVLTARLPRYPPVTNAFAQIRIGAQALRGLSAVHSSEWACGA
jgi:hypothetical protein